MWIAVVSCTMGVTCGLLHSPWRSHTAKPTQAVCVAEAKAAIANVLHIAPEKVGGIFAIRCEKDEI